MMKNPVRKTRGKKTEKGQAIILIVFSIIGLIGMSALAIDGGNAYLERRKTQNAADAAALSGAIARIEGRAWREAALASAQANGYDNNGITNTVELNTPPISGPNSDNPEYIQVIVTSYLDTFFGAVVGVPQIIVSTQAISRSKPAEYGQMFEGYALVSLAPHSGCEVKRSFWIHGEATISLFGGGLFINSDNSNCAYIQEGSGSVRIEGDYPFSIVGGASIQKPKLHTPFPPQTGAIPMPYPPPFQMPKAGCGSKIAEVIGEEGSSMSSGNWDDDFPPEGVVTLESGVYCIGGDVIVDGVNKLSGSGVVLVIEQGRVHFGGDAEIQLSAPKGGDLQGLLIYMPPDNKNRISLNGNAQSGFRGTILAPSGDIRLNGMGSDGGYKSQIIGYYIEVDGTDNIIIDYHDELNYDAYRMPEVLLSQ
jgi:hypothetical protein